MKKKLLILGFIISGVAIAATSYTTHYDLAKPADGDTNWGSGFRSNMDTIDATLYANATGVADHVADTSGAHAASAISTTVGAVVCSASITVQAYLDCLDTYVGTIVNGSVVTIAGSQTITGAKTFSAATTFNAALIANSTLAVSGAVTLSSSLGVTGTATLDEVVASGKITQTIGASDSNGHLITQSFSPNPGGTGVYVAATSSGTGGGGNYFGIQSQLTDSSGDDVVGFYTNISHSGSNSANVFGLVPI